MKKKKIQEFINGNMIIFFLFVGTWKIKRKTVFIERQHSAGPFEKNMRRKS